MREGPPQNPEKRKSAHETLFEQLGVDGFVRHLESQGIQITAREDVGEQRLTVHCPEGVYRATVGFPEISPDDERYFYGNLPPEMQERALELDIEHPAFQKLRAELAQALSGKTHKVEDVMPALKAIIEKNLTNDLSDEHVKKLSQIIAKGKTACAGMTAVGGLLTKSVAPELSVSAITGSPLQFDSEIPVDFSHEWLRISDDNHVALYDPLYKRLAIYEIANPSMADDDPFEKYQVFAWGVAPFAKGKTLSISPNIKAVTRPGGNSYELWVVPEDSIAVQVFGELSFAAKNSGSDITIADGNIELSRNPENRKSGRHMIPIRKLSRQEK